MSLICETCGTENSGYTQVSPGIYRFTKCRCLVPTDTAINDTDLYKTMGQIAREQGLWPGNEAA